MSPQERGRGERRLILPSFRKQAERLRGAALNMMERVLTPSLDLEKLSDVDVIVVHGGSGKNGVALGMAFQDIVDIEKRKARGICDEDLDLRPPIVFSGLYSRGTPQERRPRLRDGTITSQADYMREQAVAWGIPQELIFIEEESQTSRESVLGAIKMIKHKGIPHNTILFISPHLFTERNRILWQHYTNGTVLLPVAMPFHQSDEVDGLGVSREVMVEQRLGEGPKELIKTIATVILTKARLW